MIAWVSGRFSIVGSFALAQIRNGAQTEAIDAEIEPAPHDLNHGRKHARIVVTEIRLMRKEPVPVVGPCKRVPRPIRFLGVAEDDARSRIGLVVIAPHIQLRASDVGLLWRARWNHGCWPDV